MKLALLFAVFTSQCLASTTGEEINGKLLIKEFPAAERNIDLEDARNNKHLDISDVVKLGDQFLKKHFGDSFKRTVFGVSYKAATVKGGKIWCWTIQYHHPQNNDLNDRVFFVYLDQQGNPLMKVEPANKQ